MQSASGTPSVVLSCFVQQNACFYKRLHRKEKESNKELFLTNIESDTATEHFPGVRQGNFLLSQYESIRNNIVRTKLSLTMSEAFSIAF